MTGNKIIKSRLWRRPKLIIAILKNSFPLDPSVILFNPRLYLIKDRTIKSFLTLKKYNGFYELKTLYTFPGYRGKGYADKLLRYVISDISKNLVLQCDSKLEKFYLRYGFKRTKMYSTAYSLREKLFNVFLSKIFGYKIITMRKDKSWK